jgi:hypothetical protein
MVEVVEYLIVLISELKLTGLFVSAKLQFLFAIGFMSFVASLQHICTLALAYVC